MHTIHTELSYNDKLLINKLKELPIDFWDFKNINTSEYTHGLHTYPAVMIYPISRNILKIVREFNDVNNLLDPFCGSGTVLVEGILSDLQAVYGNDLNPLARLISKVKTTIIDSKELIKANEKFLNFLELEYQKYRKYIYSINTDIEYIYELDLTLKNGWGDNASYYLKKYCSDNNIKLILPDFKNMGYWFKPNVIIELQLIKNCINKIDNIDVKNFYWIVFSETIRLVSNRRNGEFKMFRLNSKKLKNFNPSVYNEFIKILERNISKEKDFYNTCLKLNNKTKVNILSNNSNNLDDIKDNSIDIVITSPPYGDSRTTVAYGEFSRLSLQWLDLFDLSQNDILSIDKNLMGGNKYKKGFECSLKSNILHESLNIIMNKDFERAGDVYSFYNDLNKSIGSITKKSKIGTYQFWVVGNRTVKNENLKTDVIITELAQEHGLQHIITIGRNISNKVMPSFNSPSNKIGEKTTTMVNEHIVVFKRIK